MAKELIAEAVISKPNDKNYAKQFFFTNKKVSL